MHFPERQIRRCSNDRPWVDDSFRRLIRRRQRPFQLEIVHCTINIETKSTVNESRCNGDTMSEKARLLRKITRNDGGITSKILLGSKEIATVNRDLLTRIAQGN